MLIGSLKLLVANGEGLEHVTGLRMSGDVIGIDGVFSGTHIFNAVALEDSHVRVVPFAPLRNMCEEACPVQDHMHRLLSSEMMKRSRLGMLLSTVTAEQRAAILLLPLSRRQKVRGCAEDEFPLRMSRDDIGSYLGVKLERAIDNLGLAWTPHRRYHMREPALSAARRTCDGGFAVVAFRGH